MDSEARSALFCLVVEPLVNCSARFLHLPSRREKGIFPDTIGRWLVNDIPEDLPCICGLVCVANFALKSACALPMLHPIM